MLFNTQTEEFKLKSKETCLKKYGCERACQSEIVKDKIVNTVFNKYGVKNVILNEKIKKKALTTRVKKFYKKRFFNKEDTVVPLFKAKEYKGGGKDKEYKWKCLECGREFTAFYNYKKGELPICRKCHPISVSKGQGQIIDFLKKIGIRNIKINTRSVISPYELDIYLPDYNTAIEFNGTYWHSDRKKRVKSYHLKKTELCEKNGIRLFHVWEYDWNNKVKREIVKYRLRYKLGLLKRRINIKSCKIREIKDKKIEKDFLTKTHLSGYSTFSSYCIGLYYKKELLATMSFCHSRYNKAYQWELLRFSTKYKIKGASKKMLKYFEEKIKPKSLLCYADRYWSIGGDTYLKLGFKFKETTQPSWVYCKRNKVYTRHQTQKRRLKKLFGNKYKFYKSKSIDYNMRKNGFLKLYDCGHMMYTKEYARN